MLPELEPIMRRWQETHDALLEALDEFPKDRLDWRPAPNATTPAGIISHIARAEAAYARMIGDPNDREDRTPSTWEEVRELLETSAGYVRRTVERLREEDLGLSRADQWGPLGPRVEGPLDTVWFLEQMIRHKAYHLGQINYLSLMLEESAPTIPDEH